jgi:hypothetical protein
MQRIFDGLVRAQSQGNIVLSPHAALRGLLEVARDADERQQREILSFLGQRTTLQGLQQQLDRVERRLRSAGVGPVAEYQYLPKALRLFSYQGQLERRENRLISAIDVRLSGVPAADVNDVKARWTSFGDPPRSVPGVELQGRTWFGCSPEFHSAFWATENESDGLPAGLNQGRGLVAFSLPVNDGDEAVGKIPILPCGGGAVPNGAQNVNLRLLAPTFCAKSTFSLGETVPALASSLPVPVELHARLAFDRRGTFNFPEQALRSPRFLKDVGYPAEPAELVLARPFFVSVHDRESGALLYLAYVREAGSPDVCR